jgi:hypothetical protein
LAELILEDAAADTKYDFRVSFAGKLDRAKGSVAKAKFQK